jgi:hypothetical protein
MSNNTDLTFLAPSTISELSPAKALVNVLDEKKMSLVKGG